MFESLADFVRIAAPVLTILIIIACLCAGTAMSFKADGKDHFGGA